MTLDTKVVFVMSMGLAGCKREETFTLEELDIDLEYDLDEQLEETWQEWRNEYLDGAWYFKDGR